jgi:hypothetical protein
MVQTIKLYSQTDRVLVTGLLGPKPMSSHSKSDKNQFLLNKPTQKAAEFNM